MGKVKEIYSLVDECRDILNVRLSVDEVIELDRNGSLDELLCENYSSDYYFEETDNYMMG